MREPRLVLPPNFVGTVDPTRIVSAVHDLAGPQPSSYAVRNRMKRTTPIRLLYRDDKGRERWRRLYVIGGTKPSEQWRFIVVGNKFHQVPELSDDMEWWFTYLYHTLR